MTENPRRVLVQIAREEVGVREVSGNQAPAIRKYWADTSYPTGHANREPYCAAFVCWVVAEAVRRGSTFAKPHSAAVRFLVAWAQKLTNGTLVFRPGGRHSPQAGDLVYWAFSGSTPNHIGIVAGLDGANRIKTIEANTNPAGSREGDGVYERTRTISGAAGFIRLV